MLKVHIVYIHIYVHTDLHVIYTQLPAYLLSTCPQPLSTKHSSLSCPHTHLPQQRGHGELHAALHCACILLEQTLALQQVQPPLPCSSTKEKRGFLGLAAGPVCEHPSVSKGIAKGLMASRATAPLIPTQTHPIPNC